MALQSTTHVTISWNPPRLDWLKLNTDGSSLGNPGKSGFGGLIRNNRGVWICGYAGKIERASSLESELKGILMGLRLIRVKGLENVVIETDCQEALVLLTVARADESHPHRLLINACQKDLQELKCYMVHVKREGNQCADLMAAIGREQEEEFIIYDNPPQKLNKLLENDANGLH